MAGLKGISKAKQHSGYQQSSRQRGKQVQATMAPQLSRLSYSEYMPVAEGAEYLKNSHSYLAGNNVTYFFNADMTRKEKEIKHLSKIANVGINMNDNFSMPYKTVKTLFLQHQAHSNKDGLQVPPADVRSPQQINAC